MKKKKIVIFAVLVALVTLSAVADSQFRMALQAGADFAERPSYSDLVPGFDNPANVFEGALFEVITRRVVGFGVRGLIRFTEVEAPTEYYDASAWFFDWNGALFVSGHLFGGGSFFDPFIELGYGVAGRANVSSTRSGEWIEEEGGQFRYRWYEDGDEALKNLSLFPVVAAGVAVDLSGFLFGARLEFRPLINAIPVTPVDNYPLTRFHVGIFGGLALGGHR